MAPAHPQLGPFPFSFGHSRKRGIHKLRNAPSAIGNAKGLRWRGAQGFMKRLNLASQAKAAGIGALRLAGFENLMCMNVPSPGSQS